jgi:aminodeoxyfutalosine synthase
MGPNSLCESLIEIELRDARLEAVRRTLLEGSRLSEGQARDCLETHDVYGLAALAHAVKRDRHGDAVSYVLNRQLNPTNICWVGCSFCDFAAKPGEAHAYAMDRGQILAALEGEIREVHIVGGLHPRWGIDEYLDVVRVVREARPEVQIKAYTAVEVDFFARRSRLDIRQALRAMQQAGVDTMPGGGAELFSERVRRALFPNKIGAERWLEVHQTAHELGMPTGATMLYGHIETMAERASHLLRLRAAQDESGGFRAFIPLAFQPGSEAKLAAAGDRTLPRATTSALDDLRTIATSRLVLDNVPHIKAYWIMLGLASATCALNAGASDLDGTVGTERIAHAAGAKTPEELTRAFLEDLIRDAGALPVERDALYRPVLRLEAAPAPNEVRA